MAPGRGCYLPFRLGNTNRRAGPEASSGAAVDLAPLRRLDRLALHSRDSRSIVCGNLSSSTTGVLFSITPKPVFLMAETESAGTGSPRAAAITPWWIGPRIEQKGAMALGIWDSLKIRSVASSLQDSPVVSTSVWSSCSCRSLCSSAMLPHATTRPAVPRVRWMGHEDNMRSALHASREVRDVEATAPN